MFLNVKNVNFFFYGVSPYNERPKCSYINVYVVKFSPNWRDKKCLNLIITLFKGICWFVYVAVKEGKIRWSSLCTKLCAGVNDMVQHFVLYFSRLGRMPLGLCNSNGSHIYSVTSFATVCVCCVCVCSWIGKGLLHTKLELTTDHWLKYQDQLGKFVREI